MNKSKILQKSIDNLYLMWYNKRMKVRSIKIEIENVSKEV